MFAFVSFVLAGVAPAEEPLLLRQARQAVAESVPQVAVEKLQTFLSAADQPLDQQNAAQALLVEALLAADRADDAVVAMKPLAGSQDVSTLLLKAKVFAAAGRWVDALPLFRQLASLPDTAVLGRIGEAECHHSMGNPSRAAEALETLVSSGRATIPVRLRHASLLVDLRQEKRARAALASIKTNTPEEAKWHLYTEGRLWLLDDRADAARLAFEEVLRDESHLSEPLHVGATIGIAEARLALQGSEAADKVLETFIWRNPYSAYLETVFRRLDQIYALQERPSEDELHDWAKKPEMRRAALARFYAARLQIRKRKPDKAAISLDVFVRNYPSHSLLPYVHLTQADLLLEKGDNKAALAALDAAARQATTDELRADVEFRTAFVHYRRGEFLLAANIFQRAAARSPRVREAAMFNSALATLNLKNFDRFFEEYTSLSQRYPESPLRSVLLLEQGLLQARVDDPRAEETLQLFLQHFSRHPRVAEAQVALAELAFLGPNPGAASQYLQVAQVAHGAPEIDAQADYLAVFEGDAKTPRDEDAVLALAEKFIEEHRASPLLREVRMKLGQIFFRKRNFAGAEAQFAALARENPLGEYTETALFLAGQSAIQTINKGAVDRALEFFDQVVKRQGPLELFARQQQAIVQSGIKKETEAIKLYDVILGAPALEPELRYAAICGKGDNLQLLGRHDPKQLEAAIKTFESLATLPEVPALWRNQALYKKAFALELLAAPVLDEREKAAILQEAIVAYYDVLEPKLGGEREFFWYYKAGFGAARLFESQQQWKPAIAIYEKMARAAGPRSAAASAKMKQLRLQHFIPWD